MRRILPTLLGIVFLALLVMAAVSEAATPGTITEAITFSINPSVKILVFTCIGGSDGSFPSFTTTSDITSQIEGYFITEVRTVPGSPNPTASYGIVLNDSRGIDLMGGTMVARSASAAQRSIPALATGIYGATEVDSGGLTLVITSNFVASAAITITVFMAR
jgi:hypothetical protein